MAFDVTITADKDGFLEHLAAVRAGHVEMAKNLTGAAKARENGIAEGIAQVITKIEQWETLADAQARTDAEANGRVPGSSWQPSTVT